MMRAARSFPIQPQRPPSIVALIALPILLWPVGAAARTLLVPSEMKTVQSAVDRASPGDTIQIGPGVYRENVVIEKARGGIVIRGERWRGTILDGGAQGRVLTFIEVSGDTRVEDVTLRNGAPEFDGGGIYVYNGKIALLRCRITGNVAEGDGGGIAIYGGEIFMNECTLQANRARRGGGIHAVGSKVRMTSSTISGNSADDSGGGLYADSCTLSLIRNYILENHAEARGGGIVHMGSRGTYGGNVISRNRAPKGGGLYCESDSQPVLKENSFSGNEPEDTLGCTGAP